MTASRPQLRFLSHHRKISSIVRLGKISVYYAVG